MKTRQFDQMTVALGTDASRRRVLGGLGAAVGHLLGREMTVDAAGRHKGGGKKGHANKRKAKKDQAKNGGDAAGLEAKPLCTTDVECQTHVAGTCLIGTCTKPVGEDRIRCVYTRDNSRCTEYGKSICCNYRLSSPTSGICVAKGEDCRV